MDIMVTMKYIVYVIQSSSGKLYIGHTNNLERRLFEHTNGLSTYTKRVPGSWQLVYQEHFVTRGQAMKREKDLKTGKGRDFLKSVIVP